MWVDLEELDRKWQLRQIGSEEEYMSQKQTGESRFWKNKHLRLLEKILG